MPTELAKAYVQIVPSAQGIKGKITEELGGEASSAGRSAGFSIAGAIKTAIAAAGIGAALKSALNEGAALQQSIGGIETLFKDSAETVKAAAAEAYRTAGMSANEYMETVTSFSASLLQGLGGDTAKAASIADMAITDMSDNANKMGTDMSLIQNAYMGFAKQNYTMLDNLKLGYGGTKTEMQRLLKDAQALTGVKYDISNLSDVYSAIHAIQENLDITGTTAKEAASTFSGSLASMKAAGSNLLADLALGEDIGPSLYALQETVYTFAVGNLIPMLGSVMSSLPDVISGALSMAIQGLNIASDNADAIIQMGIDLVAGIAESIIGALPYLAQAAVSFVIALGESIISTDWLAVGQGIIQTLDDSLDLAAMEILGTDGDIIGSVAQAIKTNLPLIVAEGIETIKSLMAGVKESLPGVAQSAGEVVAEFLAKIGAKLPEILQKGITIAGELIAGIIRSIPKVIATAGELISNFLSGFKSYNWGEIGSNIISGIAGGISAGVGAIADAARSAARSALDSAKRFLGIASPSKVMRDQIGRFIPEGVAAGISQNMGVVTDAMEDITKATAGSLSADLNVKAVASAQRHDSIVANGRISSQEQAEELKVLRDMCESLPDMIANAVSTLRLQVSHREFGRLVREV